jgi:UDP-GlcNAc:undecaprenyl-phosphate GlcNAc-1-phosphate transferase
VIYLLVGVFLVTLGLIWLIRRNAQSWGLMDIPNTRSVHTVMTPRGAGIAFFIGVFSLLPLFYFDVLFHYSWTLLAILFVFLVGAYDDYSQTTPKIKFFVLAIATLLLCLDDLVIDDVGYFFGHHLYMGWLSIPFTFFAVSGFTNALNLIDGLDGLATSISLVILTTFFIVGYRHHDMFMMLFSSTFFMALCAFLVYNWYPATIFMGDSGSLTIGFVISLLSLKSLDYIAPSTILFITAIPILDTIIVMIRRKRNGRSIFSPNNCHIHHIVKKYFGGNTVYTVLFLAFFQSLYSFFGMQFDKDIDGSILLFGFIINIIVLYVVLEYMRKRKHMNC